MGRYASSRCRHGRRFGGGLGNHAVPLQLEPEANDIHGPYSHTRPDRILHAESGFSENSWFSLGLRGRYNGPCNSSPCSRVRNRYCRLWWKGRIITFRVRDCNLSFTLSNYCCLNFISLRIHCYHSRSYNRRG